MQFLLDGFRNIVKRFVKIIFLFVGICPAQNNAIPVLCHNPSFQSYIPIDAAHGHLARINLHDRAVTEPLDKQFPFFINASCNTIIRAFGVKNTHLPVTVYQKLIVFLHQSGKIPALFKYGIIFFKIIPP